MKDQDLFNLLASIIVPVVHEKYKNPILIPTHLKLTEEGAKHWGVSPDKWQKIEMIDISYGISTNKFAWVGFDDVSEFKYKIYK